MSNLNRQLAPFEESAWTQIDAVARQTLRRLLAARRVVDFNGPLGYEAACIGRGRVEPIETPLTGVKMSLHRTQPLVEQRIDFALDRATIEAMGRGSGDEDLGAVARAAQLAALSEDSAVFYGLSSGRIDGILETSKRHSVKLPMDYESYPSAVANGLTWLRNQGVDGPYALALGPRCYQGLTETANTGGFPILDLVRQQLDGGILWAPALRGATLLSTRGGDFELTVGRDFSIGYAHHDTETVGLFIESSFTFLARSPEAAVPLYYGETIA
jgi:uncharacterized linocin/CFP29 family protein